MYILYNDWVGWREEWKYYTTTSAAYHSVAQREVTYIDRHKCKVLKQRSVTRWNAIKQCDAWKGLGSSETSHGSCLRISFVPCSYKIWCKAVGVSFMYLSPFATCEHLKTGIIRQWWIEVDFSVSHLFLSCFISPLPSPLLLSQFHEWLSGGLDRLETSYCLEDWNIVDAR